MKMTGLMAMVAILLLAPFAHADENAESAAKGRTLDCGGNVVITGAGAKSIVLQDGPNANFDFTVDRRTDGDCTNRKGYACYQDGQLMVNIPISLTLGLVRKATVWINEDTDDRPENHRLGDNYVCTLQ